MSKQTYPAAKGRADAPAAKTTKIAPLATGSVKTPVQASAPSAETKAPRNKKADRPTCAAARSVMANTDLIRVAKVYDGRQGTLRANIVAAIQGAATVWDACKLSVNGPGKHSELAYTVKKVDIGFCLGNGYITLTPAPAAKK